jgi:Xaa-Pro dipeptidase
MEVLDASNLAERLKWEAKEYWLHLEAETPLEKYPGEHLHVSNRLSKWS